MLGLAWVGANGLWSRLAAKLALEMATSCSTLFREAAPFFGNIYGSLSVSVQTVGSGPKRFGLLSISDQPSPFGRRDSNFSLKHPTKQIRRTKAAFKSHL